MTDSTEYAGCKKACLHCDNNTVTDVSKVFLEMTGYTERELLYKRLPEVFQMLFGLDLSPFDTENGVVCLLIAKNCKVEEIHLETRNFSPYAMEIYIASIEDGSVPHTGDNLIRRQINLILNTNRNLETIFDNMMDAVFITDRHGNILKLNATARNFFRNYGTMTHINDMYLGAEYLDTDGKPIPARGMPASSIMKGEQVSQRRMHIRNREGEIYVDTSGKAILNDKNEIELVVLCSRDVTAKVQLEEYMTNELKMKDEFLSFISHEFKTPLAVITSAIQAIETICRDDLTDKLKGFLRKIRQNSYRQVRLVDNLLDLTRVEAGKIRLHRKNIDIVFLTRSITDSVAPYVQQKGVNLFFESELNQKIIGIDDEKYERILLNLLSNAIKFTPVGKSVYVSVTDEKDNVIIKVRDEGIGIPKERQDIIFNRFGQVDSIMSREAEGAGLGLSLTKMFISALGGEIKLESGSGQGSTFTVLLPAGEVQEDDTEQMPKNLNDRRLIQSIAIEFSDIYY